MAELHAISTGRQSLDEWLYISFNIHNYVNFLHIREKDWTKAEKQQAVQRLLEGGVPTEKIIVNNEPDLVRQFQLYGVHFPEKTAIQRYEKGNIRYGVSVHDKEIAVEKEQQGADYLFFGHIFPTKSKPSVPPRGLKSLKKVTHAVCRPVIAIGGITPERVASCISAGAAGVAVLSGIYEAEDPVSCAKAYQTAIKESRNGQKL